MKKLLIGMLGLLFSAGLFAEEILYCSSELSTGIAKKNDKWITGNFNDARFTVKVNNNFESIIIGTDKYDCYLPYPSTAPENIICNERTGYSFRYSTKTKRFMRIVSSTSGYISGNDTSNIEAGKCETF